MSFVSTSSGFQQVFQLLKKKCYVPNKKCPKCGRYTLLQPGGIDSLTGRPRVPAVCYHCGYKAHYKNPEKTKFLAEKGYSLRVRNAKLYFENHSVLPSLKEFNSKTFNNYKANTPKLRAIRKKCLQAVHEMQLNHPVHLILLGNTGVGKTHLAYAVMHAYLKGLSYRPKIMALNMVDTPFLQRKAIHDDPTQEYMDSVLQQIGQADLVLLDDVGRESNTEWNQLIINAVTNLRTNKSLILTSNLNQFNRYSHQIRDRLTTNSKGFIIEFVTEQSHRNSVKITNKNKNKSKSKNKNKALKSK